MIDPRGTATDEFGRTLRAWLQGDAPVAAPPTLDGTIINAARTLTQRRAPIVGLSVPQPWSIWILGRPAARRGLQLLAVMLLLALAAAAIVATGSRVHRPAPISGLARNGLVAFESGGQIVVANKDGSQRSALTGGGGMHSTPVWSLDGTKLAFWTHQPDGLQLTVTDADGRNPRVVSGALPVQIPSSSSRDSVWPSAADWAPNGQDLAFSAMINGQSRILVAGVGGGEPRALGDPSLAALSPAWSPDGARIAFAGGRFPDAALWVMNADGSSPARLTRYAGSVGSFVGARWSADGRRLAYPAGNHSLSHDIWLVNADATGEVDLGSPARDWTDDTWPTWSPDGQRIAFVRTTNMSDGGTTVGVPRVFVMNADGSALNELFVASIDDAPPQWSPDGTLILAKAANPEGFFLLDSRAASYPAFIPAADTASGASWERLVP
jgi:Tol biopolymer transport system component